MKNLEELFDSLETALCLKFVSPVLQDVEIKESKPEPLEKEVSQ